MVGRRDGKLTRNRIVRKNIAKLHERTWRHALRAVLDTGSDRSWLAQGGQLFLHREAVRRRRSLNDPRRHRDRAWRGWSATALRASPPRYEQYCDVAPNHSVR